MVYYIVKIVTYQFSFELVLDIEKLQLICMNVPIANNSIHEYTRDSHSKKYALILEGSIFFNKKLSQFNIFL